MGLDALSLLLSMKSNQTGAPDTDIVRVIRIVAPEEETTVIPDEQMGLLTVIEAQEA